MARRLLLSVVCVASLLAAWAVPGAGMRQANAAGGTLLALGDSVPFGFNPNLSTRNASNFVGWPDVLAPALGMTDVNATCPGEATGGYLSSTGTDNGCRFYKAFNPLHVSYRGTQDAFAVNFLRNNPVALVTLMIGANDAFVFQRQCGSTNTTCINNDLVNQTEPNLETILSHIRGTGYSGKIIVMTYYAQTYTASSTAPGNTLNQVIVQAAGKFNATVADGFTSWKDTALAAGGDSCAAGLLIINNSNGQCDVHPTPSGRDLLKGAAQAVA